MRVLVVRGRRFRLLSGSALSSLFGRDSHLFGNGRFGERLGFCSLGSFSRLHSLVIGKAGTGRDQTAERSTLPLIAASLSTFVVSWKEAAEMKESVESEAFVIPRSRFS